MANRAARAFCDYCPSWAETTTGAGWGIAEPYGWWLRLKPGQEDVYSDRPEHLHFCSIKCYIAWLLAFGTAEDIAWAGLLERGELIAVA